MWENRSLNPFFYVANLKLLGRGNSYQHVLYILAPLIILTITYDYAIYAITLLKTLY